MVELLAACYDLDVLKGDRAALLALLSSPYAQGMSEEARKCIPQYQSVSQQCFISRKYAEYLKLL
jgi:hypothetical protein